MSITLAYDVTHANLPSAPKGVQLFGYATGSGGIAWTAADWAAHPGAGRIDQDVAASDGTADVLDVENGAVPVGSAEIARWAKVAMASFAAATRPGQREPAIYMSASNVTAVVNALIAGGVKSGVGLWVANWNMTQAQAVANVLAASGPFPVIGVQFRDAGPDDVDVFSSAWLAKVSAKPAPPPPPPPQSLVSATPHLVMNASWPVHAGAIEYQASYTPTGGHPSELETIPQPAAGGAVHVAGIPMPTGPNMSMLPGIFTVNAIVNGKPVLVGTVHF